MRILQRNVLHLHSPLILVAPPVQRRRTATLPPTPRQLHQLLPRSPGMRVLDDTMHITVPAIIPYPLTLQVHAESVPTFLIVCVRMFPLVSSTTYFATDQTLPQVLFNAACLAFQLPTHAVAVIVVQVELDGALTVQDLLFLVLCVMVAAEA